jgi:uncharacterized tellurite resistance protein B-like protein
MKEIKKVEDFSPIEAVVFPILTIIGSDQKITPEEIADLKASINSLYGEGGIFPEITAVDAMEYTASALDLSNSINDFRTKTIISLQCCKKLNQIIDNEEKKRVVASYLIDAANSDGQIDEIEDQLLKMFVTIILNGMI